MTDQQIAIIQSLISETRNILSQFNEELLRQKCSPMSEPKEIKETEEMITKEICQWS